MSFSPSDVANACMEDWKPVWRAGVLEPVRAPTWESETLQSITEEDVRRALKRFQWRTGVGMCGWNPKDWEKLSDEGISSFTRVFNLFERSRTWPGTVLNTILVRIPKPGRGHRLIGLLVTLFRVWGKVRREYCQEWEDRNRKEYDYACKQRGATGEMWDVALLDECARKEKATTACWAADLSKFYERIPHWRLLQCAKDEGFHPTIAWLALQVYGGVRRIRVDQAFSEPASVGQGIIAGCSLATTLVKVFMWKALDRAVKSFPMIKLRVYLDDLLLQWVGKLGKHRFVHVDQLVEAVKYYSEAIQIEWGGVVNREKLA